MDFGGTSNKHLKPTANALTSPRNAIIPLISPVNSDGERNRRTDSEITLNGMGHSFENSDSSDTVPSSSSNSSSDDYIQVDHRIFSMSNAPNNIPKKPIGPIKPFKIDVASEALYRLEESINESPESTSWFSDITVESHISPTQSPPVQVMERPAGFDPSRIPNSIFTRPSSPMDWSVASNESLFSIHIGNNSFSRDHASRIGMYRSEELPKSGELQQSEELYKSGEFYTLGEVHKSSELSKAREVYRPGDPKKSDESISFGKMMPPSQGVETSNVKNEINVEEDMNHRAKKDEPIRAVNDRVNPSWREPRDISETSIRPVAFPIKQKKSTCPMCHCSHYSRPSCPSCCCKWPSCPWKCLCCWSCRWLSWSCCCPKWQSCHCKCPSWPSYHCKCPTCSSCSFKCCTLPSCSFKCCALPRCCCKCPSRPSFNCHCPSCSWTCCCLNHKSKKPRHDTPYIITDGGLPRKGYPENQHPEPSSMKASKGSPEWRYSCFSCSSSCSCCSCFSCSCCCWKKKK